jgi:hypothetical protein
VFSPEKDGVDLGELVGVAPIGVAATRDKEAIFELDADCVIHAPMPALDDTEMTADVEQLLESGKSVVSAAGYHYPPRRGSELAGRLERACQNGGAALHGSGINPGFVFERLALTLTGVMTDVQLIKLTEVVDCTKMLDKSPAAAAIVGWGSDPATLTEDSPSHLIIDPYYRDMLAFVARRLFGAEPDDVTIVSAIDAIPAQRRFEHGSLVVEPGAAITVHHSQRAEIDGRHVLTHDAYWYLGSDNVPIDGPTGDSTYMVQVKGKPAALDMRLNVDSTMADDIPITTYITAVPLLQAVVPACEAEPGIMYTDARPHWCSDFRRLARAGVHAA